ncbi:hypothetical protein BDL97_11G092500 [Sphagnum fallax]|nr:hypothetical protein BDL97_11G092500 [Sphagnum fallax]
MGSSGMVVCPPVWCIRSSCLLQQLRSAKMKFLQLDCKTFCINTKTGSAVLDVLNMPVYARKSGDEAFEDKEAWLNKNSHLSTFHHEGDIVAGKYTIVGVLGQGGASTTYEAKTQDGEVVALKALSLRNMRGWKDLELFEREAKVLKSLRYPSIPEYIDYFQIDSPSDCGFYIVQRVAKGRSLKDLVESGWRVPEEEVKRIAIEVLDVLQYLGSLRPPVYHRDIKPENIILDEASGKVKLVDFGAVQDAASAMQIGSTVVGTYGYMAPEQFQNRAGPQTDLYGLGATLLYVVSGCSPSSFPQKRLKVVFRDLVNVTPHLGDVIEQLLEPAPEDRFQSAEEAINALKGEASTWMQSSVSQKSPGNAWQLKTAQQPAGTEVDLKKTDSQLVIVIPPAGLTAETAGTGSFAVAWNVFLTFWTRTAIVGGAPLLFTLFSLPFWFVGIRLAKTTLSSLTVAAKLQFKESEFSIEWTVGGSLWKHQVVGQLDDISSVGIVVEGKQDGQLMTACMLVEGVKTHKFGMDLKTNEKEWLVQEISSFLQIPCEQPTSSNQPFLNIVDAYDQRTGSSDAWNGE